MRDPHREVANAPTEQGENDENVITPEMAEAGEDELLRNLGGADLGGLFSARETACAMYRAMRSARQRERLVPQGVTCPPTITPSICLLGNGIPVVSESEVENQKKLAPDDRKSFTVMSDRPRIMRVWPAR
jgi:hypothetical protein